MLLPRSWQPTRTLPGLDGPSAYRRCTFVACVRAEGITSHQLVSDLLRNRGIHATSNVDRRQFCMFPLVVHPEFGPFQLKVGVFGVRL